MPDITTLFEGTDGVSRTLFNQKLSDINAHGNDAAMHVTAAERTRWNGGANGNGGVWVANTTVADPSYPNDLWTLSIPNFVFTEGCQVTFIPPTKASGTKYNAVIIGNKFYALRTLNKEAIEVDSWEAGASVTVTLSVTKVPINGDNARDGTAFFKSGSGSIKEMYDFPLSIQTTEPTPVNTNHIWIQNNTKMPVVLDEAIRASDWDGDNRYYAIVDNTDNTDVLTSSPKKTTDGYPIDFVNRHIAKDIAPWFIGNVTFSKKYGLYYWSFAKSKWPRIMSRINGVIDVENAKRWDGSAWQWLSQKGTYLFTPTTMWNRNNSTLTNQRNFSEANAHTVSVSLDRNYIATAYSSDLRIYQRNGDSFTLKNTFNTSLASTIGTNVVFSPDSQYLAVPNKNTNICRIYKKQSDSSWSFLTEFTCVQTYVYAMGWSDTGAELVIWTGMNATDYNSGKLSYYTKVGNDFLFSHSEIAPSQNTGNGCVMRVSNGLILLHYFPSERAISIAKFGEGTAGKKLIRGTILSGYYQTIEIYSSTRYISLWMNHVISMHDINVGNVESYTSIVFEYAFPQTVKISCITISQDKKYLFVKTEADKRLYIFSIGASAFTLIGSIPFDNGNFSLACW